MEPFNAFDVCFSQTDSRRRKFWIAIQGSLKRLYGSRILLIRNLIGSAGAEIEVVGGQIGSGLFPKVRALIARKLCPESRSNLFSQLAFNGKNILHIAIERGAPEPFASTWLIEDLNDFDSIVSSLNTAFKKGADSQCF